MLFGFKLYKPHLQRLGTTITSLPYLELYLLPLPKGSKIPRLKLVTVEEKVFTFVCVDKPKATVRNEPLNCTLWQAITSVEIRLD